MLRMHVGFCRDMGPAHNYPSTPTHYLAPVPTYTCPQLSARSVPFFDFHARVLAAASTMCTVGTLLQVNLRLLLPTSTPVPALSLGAVRGLAAKLGVRVLKQCVIHQRRC